MAAVPEYRRQLQLRPVNQQEVRVGTSPDTFGAQVGRAAETVGAGLFRAADALDFRAQLTDDASAREAFNKYRYAQREALSAPESGLLNQTGGNATGVPETGEARLAALRERYGEGLTPRARRKYDELTNELLDQAHGSLLTHASNETRNYIVNQRTSTIEGYVEDAAKNWDSTDVFERNLALALQEQTQLAALQGWDAATQKQSAETLISKAFRQRIVMAAADDPIAAAKLLEDAREVLTAEDENALDTGLEAMVLEAQASQFTQSFIRRTQPVYGGATRSGVEFRGVPAVDRPDDNVTISFDAEIPGQPVVDVITSAAEATFGAGTRVALSSGVRHGENDPSGRHRTGAAADVTIYRPDGTVVKATDPDAADFARAAAAQGALGIGFGAEYMGGTEFHIDMVVPRGKQWHYWASGAAAIGTSLVAIMERAASAALEGTPFPDSAVNRGLVVQLGAGLGLTIIDAAQNRPTVPAEYLMTPEFMAANPSFAGMTMGEMYDAIAAATGDDPSTQMGAAYFDAGAAYDAALAIEDQKLRDEVLKSIDTMATLQNRARTEGRGQAQDAAWEEYVRTGRTSFSMDERAAMGQSGWTSFQEAVRNDQRGVDVTNPDTWEMLTRLASSNPNAFAELSLTQHYASLSRADRQHFIAVQEAARAELKGQALKVEQGRNAINFDAVYEAADEVYLALADPTSPAKMSGEQRRLRLDFQHELTALVQDFYDRENREPNTREVREMAAVKLLPVEFSTPGRFFTGAGFDGVNEKGSGFLFEAAKRTENFRVAVTYDSIPIADRTRIASQLMQATGELPTQDQITTAYEQQRMMAVGLPPVVAFSEIPPDFVEVARKEFPGIADDAIVEHYQLFLMSQYTGEP